MNSFALTIVFQIYQVLYFQNYLLGQSVNDKDDIKEEESERHVELYFLYFLDLGEFIHTATKV